MSTAWIVHPYVSERFEAPEKIDFVMSHCLMLLSLEVYLMSMARQALMFIMSNDSSASRAVALMILW